MELLTGAISSVVGKGITAVGHALLTSIGFTSGGVAAGSVAAGVQAGIGNVTAGSAFAALQSIGTTGAVIASVPCVILESIHLAVCIVLI